MGSVGRLSFERQRGATQLMIRVNGLVKKLVPVSIRLWLRRQERRFSHRPPLGWVRFGSLRRFQPICPNYGFSRGQPIDRYYIEQFLAEYSDDIKGHVLEIAEDRYSSKFGGAKVIKLDILHPDDQNPDATIVADLTRSEQIESNIFDCIVITQTLPYIYDLRSAIETLHRVLKPDGVLLITNPSLGRIDQDCMDKWGDFWRFTPQSTQRLLEHCFSPSKIVVRSYGNLLSATAFLHGLSAEELKPRELNYNDVHYPVSVVARAVKCLIQAGWVFVPSPMQII